MIVKAKSYTTSLFGKLFRVLVTVLVIGTLFAWSLLLPVQADSNYLQAGVDRMLSGDFPAAIASFSKSIDRKLDLNSAYANRCLAYLQIQKYDQAIDDCTIAINNYNNLESSLNRGLAYFHTGKYQNAIADFDRILITNPDYRAYYNRGLAKFALRQLPEAIADYDLALAVIEQNNPQLSEIYNERGLTYFFLKDLDTALQNYAQAIVANSNSDRAYFNRGCAYQSQRNYALAANDFSQALNINSHNPEALMNRAIAFRNLGKKSQAITDLNTAAQEFLAQGLVDDYNYALDLATQLGDQDSSAIAYSALTILKNGTTIS